MTTPGSAQKTVLVADGRDAVRTRVAAAIEAAGHQAWGAATAPEALAIVQADAERLDLIVLDLRIGSEGGLALMRDLRRVEGGRVPVLVCSGSLASARDVRELAELGVVGYVNEWSPDEQILPALAPHLFPDNFNRRGSPRVVMGIPVAYRFANTIAAAVTLNLDKGGVAIRTMSPLVPPARARVRFRLPTHRQDVDAEARVTWADRRVGMGLEFERVDAVDQLAIDDFVDGDREEG